MTEFYLSAEKIVAPTPRIDKDSIALGVSKYKKFAAHAIRIYLIYNDYTVDGEEVIVIGPAGEHLA